MPYDTTRDLPKPIKDKYSEHGQRAFLAAFNSAMSQYDGDESKAFAIAHAAAQKAEEKAKRGGKASEWESDWDETLKEMETDPLEELDWDEALLEAEESEEELYSFEPSPQEGKHIVSIILNWFKSKKDVSQGFKLLSNDKWVGWYTNAYQDRDGEWVSEKALARDVERKLQTRQFPELRFGHLAACKIGQAEVIAKVGRYMVGVGHFDNTPLATAIKSHIADSDHDWTMSHGFEYPPSSKVKGVYYDIDTFEISVLPAGIEANSLTLFAVKEGQMAETAIPHARPILNELKQALAGTGIDPEVLVQAGLAQTAASDKATGGNFKAVDMSAQPAQQGQQQMPMQQQNGQVVESAEHEQEEMSKMDKILELLTYLVKDEQKETQQQPPMQKTAQETQVDALTTAIKALTEKVERLEAEKVQQAKSVQDTALGGIIKDYLMNGSKGVEENAGYEGVNTVAHMAMGGKR